MTPFAAAGHAGDLAVRAELRGEVSFDEIGGSRVEVLAANGLTAPDGGAPAAEPAPLVSVDPVWPYELLVKGEGGSASVELAVSNTGGVTDVKVREATHPELGEALRAAVVGWNFQPAMAGGRAVDVTLLKKMEFAPVAADAKADSADPLARLVALARGEGIGSAKGLDEKLAPLYRVAPEYPASFPPDARPAGAAEIEFVIDREGRARLPRVVSATLPEFGWAAATAVNQWVFKAPRRQGAPVDVKVKIPFNFAAPR